MEMAEDGLRVLTGRGRGQVGRAWGPEPGCWLSAWLRGGVARIRGLDAM